MNAPEPVHVLQAQCMPLAGEMTIGMASTLRDQLLTSLPSPGVPMLVDLAEVEAFDSAGVQLLLALRHTLASRGSTLMLQAPSAPVRQALRTYGLEALDAPPWTA